MIAAAATLPSEVLSSAPRLPRIAAWLGRFNLKTAKAVGLDLPPTLLALADKRRAFITLLGRFRTLANRLRPALPEVLQ